jgi:hypothetical protein
MMRLGLISLPRGSEGAAGGGQAWPGGEEGTVIWIVVMMLLDLGLRDVVGGGQAWRGGEEEGIVIWIMVVMMLDLDLRGEGGVVVEGCLDSHREEEERVVTVRTTMMML